MKNKKRIIIVGGVAGGASAAARARRLSEEAEIVLVERGEYISFANCGLPYHIGGTIEKRELLLVQTPEAMQKRFRIDVRTRTEAVRVDPGEKTILLRDLEKGSETLESYDELILSPGAESVRPPLPGAESPLVFTLRNMRDMDAIKAVVDKMRPTRALVVGGGYIGLEMAEAFRSRGLEVTLAELAPQVFVAADPEMIAPVHNHLRLHGVDLRLETSVSAFEEKDGRLEARLSTGESVDCDLAILAVGVRPECALAREAGLEIGSTGGIAVDDRMRTSDPHIFAVGDAVEVDNFVGGDKALIPLAGPANRQGRIAADNALGRDSVYRRTQGTAICKIFDLAVGMTGMNEKALQSAGVAYEKIHIHPADHASYYPGASQLSMKVLFSPDGGKILGAQAVGAAGVDKRIDVLAVAIRAGLTVVDLQDLELCYAPPYGSAKDPVNYAGFVASNFLKGDTALCHASDVSDPADGQFLLDVRMPSELKAGTIPGAVNISLDDLRERLDELPKDKDLLVFCQVGLRGHLACRILTQNGFQCSNLSGGYKTYKDTLGMSPEDQPNTTQKTEGETLKNATAPAEISSPAKTEPPLSPALKEIDARGLQCPGPIMRLSQEIESLAPGQALSIVASDPGFPSDIAAWCESTGHILAETTPDGAACRAVVVKGAPLATVNGESQAHAPNKKNKTIVVFSGDFDKAMATFIIANGAAAMDSDVTLFFTFWGLNILRRPEKVAVQKNLVERMFGWMMPRGASRLTLSEMHMAGMGTAMIKGIMKRKNVDPLPELIEKARESGVHLVACAMSMDLMGIRPEELIDGVEIGGVARYLNAAEASGMNLFV